MNRTEPLCCSGVLRGVCACMSVVKGTVLCADLRASHMSVCLYALWEYVPSHLATGWTWRLASVAALHPWGQEWPWGRRGSPWGPKPLHLATSNSTQLQSIACHRSISCPGKLHRSGTHCWLLFFQNCFPATLFDSPRFMSQKRQWKLAPTSFLCVSHESSCKQCSEKVIKLEGSPQSRALWESPPAFCSKLQLQWWLWSRWTQLPPAKHHPFVKWVELP